jgi:hypothetical protein
VLRADASSQFGDGSEDGSHRTVVVGGRAVELDVQVALGKVAEGEDTVRMHQRGKSSEKRVEMNDRLLVLHLKDEKKQLPIICFSGVFKTRDDASL